MKLKKLFKDIAPLQIKGSKELEITGVCINSKVVAPGNLFIAKKGLSDDGSLYIHEAVLGGAAAVLTDIFDPTLNIAQVIHTDVASIEGKIAAEYYQYPSDELFTVGITGTNGKTTTSFIIKYLLDAIDGPCGLIGTIENIIGLHRYQAIRTTPDVSSNQKMLREMVLQGCHCAVLEVTSHALDQKRTAYIDFDVAVFTNLSLDHLDYHQNMDNYCHAKQKLFTSLNKQKRKKHQCAKTAIVNADCLWTAKILQHCEASTISYGIDNHATLRAKNLVMTAQGTAFDLHYNHHVYEAFCPLIGRHNVENWLAAAAVGLVRKASIEQILAILKSVPPVQGRLEKVSNTQELSIYVDFAHSDDALKNVLNSLKELNPCKIITVFGCGGDRDRSKRPKMAQVSSQYSHLTIVTSDNPRSEDPAAICAEIAKGFDASANFLIIVDRQAAIDQAIALANPGDIVLIAGKGHEPYQIFAHKTIEFDDRKAAQSACKKREPLCTI